MLSVVYQDSEYGPLPVVLAVFLMREDAEVYVRTHTWAKIVDVESWDAWADIRRKLVEEKGHA